MEEINRLLADESRANEWAESLSSLMDAELSSGGPLTGVPFSTGDLDIVVVSLLCNHQHQQQQRAILATLAACIRTDMKHRAKLVAATLKGVATHLNSLHPAAVADSHLLAAIVEICQNDTNPAILATAYSLLTLVLAAIRASLSLLELDVLFSLMTRAIHWEVICNAVFRITRTGTQIDKFLEANNSVSAATSAPSSAASATTHSFGVEDLEDLDFVVQMDDLEANTQLPHQHPQQTAFDILISTLSATSIRRSVDSLFTVLYALFPHQTLEAIRTRFSPNVVLSWVNDVQVSFGGKVGVLGSSAGSGNSTFQAAWDPFHVAFGRLLELEVLDEAFLVRQRVTNLIKAHRVHPVLVFATREDEIRMVQQGGSRTAAEVLVECLLLRCGNSAISGVNTINSGTGSDVDSSNSSSNVPDASSPETPTAKDPITTAAVKNNNPINNISSNNLDINTVLIVNRMLRKSVLDHTASIRPPTKTHTSPMQLNTNDMIQHHLTLLLCELNYELCVRGAYMDQVLKLRREKSVEVVGVVDRENVYQKLRSQQQELMYLNSTLDQLRSETATTRERHRKYEEDLNKRLRVARDTARESKEALSTLMEQVGTKDAEMDSLKKKLEFSNQWQLEQELHLVEPDLERLVECEASLKTLNHKFVQRELESSTREALLKHIEDLESQLCGFEISLSNSENQIKHLQHRIQELEQSASTTATDSTLKCEELIARHAKAMDSLRVANIERVKIMDAKYQTVRQINLALETRILEAEK
ncbi:UNVERIFIED_CONTAM: hypothetical protein HDU68_008104 [Siphonaria sp. JEL0065]|nr:hypothetical protein HDU68_008104 [Siphonaria sp. JEL0065]